MYDDFDNIAFDIYIEGDNDDEQGNDTDDWVSEYTSGSDGDTGGN
jgi:hypothetical protein